MNAPLLSIVIANYNYGRFLEDAIQSVITQDMGDKIELIVCDAASVDNSVEIIQKYAKGLPPNTAYSDWCKLNSAQPSTYGSQLITWWCSEHDGGQSAAFNKGFSHARGKYLTWLNADDIFLPDALKKFEMATARNPQVEWLGGGCFFLDPELRIFKCARGRRISEYRRQNGLISVTGPSSFFSKELYQRVGQIDERFVYMMDIDLWARFAMLARVEYIPFAKYVWGLRLHNEAKMSGHKFTDDGKILEGKASEAAYLKNKKRLMQIEKEKGWMREKVQRLTVSPSRMGMILSADFVPAVMSRVDTWRMRGLKVNIIKETSK